MYSLFVRLHCLAAALFAIGLSAPAFAQLDTTLRATTVRAGPDHRFPQVARLTNAANVHVFGCISGRIWCDVQSGRRRGWVRASDLRQTSRLRNASIITFSVADYWGAHYRTRAWYSSLGNWLGWGTPGFSPPAPQR